MLRFALPLLLVALPQAVRADPVQAHYAAYAAGLNVLVMDASIDLSPQRYRLTVDFQTAGTFSVFVHSQTRSRVEGAFVHDIAAPTRFTSAGVLRGEQRLTQIDYQAGQPVISRLVPPADQEREPVPPEQQRGTVDTLSAMAQLVRQVNETGRCEGSVRTFDGRRLATLRAWTVGLEDLPPTRLSSYAGRALHCGFEGRQLGGFVRDEDRERLQRPQLGNAWFAATAAGQPLIPVRISFQTRWFGDATMFITPPG
jgi:hypothetical protein